MTNEAHGAATAVLRKEHDAILQMLDATEILAQRLSAGMAVEPERLTEMLEFFQIFADRCHHGKEEDLLFPLLERKGLLRAGGPVGVMLDEHEQGRALIRSMNESARGYREREANAGRRYADASRRYAALLRQHIEKENNILFMLADRLLSPAEQEELAQAFERAEVEKIGAGTHERLHALMQKFTASLLPCG
ncbi:MAG TPA: hemerythrin domain-containing protein [Candidatus Xenobia bacterium]|nr:hemerythrin domain-containing protein [Candidatus Xenobia bacterium]